MPVVIDEVGAALSYLSPLELSNSFTPQPRARHDHYITGVRRTVGRSKRTDQSMTSWRDNASPLAQRDLDGLLDPSLDFAQQQLAKYGGFYPYAVVVRVDGQTEMVAAQPDTTDDNPASTDVIAACRQAITERRDQLRAAAIVADVHLPDHGGDAIQVDLEHAEGPTLRVLLPYTKKRVRNSIGYSQLRASAGIRTIWPA
jgi:hypothetical protein